MQENDGSKAPQAADGGLLERLEKIKESGLQKIAESTLPDQLQLVRANLLGRKGELTDILKSVGQAAPELRKALGQAANEVKQILSDAVEKRGEELLNSLSAFEGEADITVPGTVPFRGGLHPVTQMCYDLNDAFRSLGFEIFSEPEIRQPQLRAGAPRAREHGHLLAQGPRRGARGEAPLPAPAPHGSFRALPHGARRARALCVSGARLPQRDDRRAPREGLLPVFASGMVLIKTILEKVFGHEVDVRMRVGFFPFVEPGFEIDMKCQVCGGAGCKVCKHVGWIEVMPGGTPHPNVLRAAGLDPSVWSGFYINIGLDRLVMMRYGVDDVRLFHSADLRFLQQFK